ncbi:hypothetical protein [Labrys miyagiensis]
MNHEDMEASIKKLQYQVRIIGSAIDYKQNPIESLILEMDWDETGIGKVHDIFEKWHKLISNGTNLTSGAFENDFRSINVDYQALKSIILAFYRNGQWVDVCEAYVDSFGASPSIEYHSIMRRERT